MAQELAQPNPSDPFGISPETAFGTMQGGILVQENRAGVAVNTSPPVAEPAKPAISTKAASEPTDPDPKPQKETAAPVESETKEEVEPAEEEKPGETDEDEEAHFIDLSTGRLDTRGMTKRQVADRVKLDGKLVSQQAEIDRLRAASKQRAAVETLGEEQVRAEVNPDSISQADLDAAWNLAEETGYVRDVREAQKLQNKFDREELKNSLLTPEEREVIAELRGQFRSQDFSNEQLADAADIISTFEIQGITPELLAESYEQSFRAEAREYERESGEKINVTTETIENFKASKDGQKYWQAAIRHARQKLAAEDKGQASVSDKGVAPAAVKPPARQGKGAFPVPRTGGIGTQSQRTVPENKNKAEADFSLSAAMAKEG